MSTRAVVSHDLPKSDLPFSHGFEAGNFVFTSGQVGVDPVTGMLTEGITAQTKQTLENVEAVLTAAGCSRRDVVKVTVFLADIANYTAMNQVYRAFFHRPYPARSCVEAKLADPAILVEIEAIACR
jgi:2-iminobutanoate/2-iminopropanoate deaminase